MTITEMKKQLEYWKSIGATGQVMAYEIMIERAKKSHKKREIVG